MYLTYFYYNVKNSRDVNDIILLKQGEKLFCDENNNNEIYNNGEESKHNDSDTNTNVSIISKECIEFFLDYVYIDDNKINENSYVVEYEISPENFYDIMETMRLRVV
jgi:hypothetical protein